MWDPVVDLSILQKIVTVYTRNYRDRKSAESLGYGVFRKSDYQVRSFELIRGGWPRMKRDIASRLAAHTLHHYITREQLQKIFKTQLTQTHHNDPLFSNPPNCTRTNSCGFVQSVADFSSKHDSFELQSRAVAEIDQQTEL